jgi:hypothetical protein
MPIAGPVSASDGPVHPQPKKEAAMKVTLLAGTIMGYATITMVVVLLGGLAFCPGVASGEVSDDLGIEAAGSFAEDGACTETARAAYRGCRYEAKDDYWIALGNCANLSDPEERELCREEAGEEFEEALELCVDQRAARLDICDVLGEDPYDPEIHPRDFVDFAKVATGKKAFDPNEYFPLVPGTIWIYVARDEDGERSERIKVEVLEETKEILGVNCIVVRDRVWEFDDEGEKELVEDTFDWYAQDREGNVWYFGEIAKNYEDGELVDVEGSWTAGKDGAKPGILMYAEPDKASPSLYRQEFALAEAEDMGQVEGFLDSLAVRRETYKDVLQTRDFTPIEPDVLEFKYYAPGVGVVLEEDVDSGERVELRRIVSP